MKTILLPVFLAATCVLPAAPMQQAEVTRVFNEVKILPAATESREARIGELIKGGTAIRTGEKSRAELKFSDQTLTRLGASSQFSFETGTRNLSLETGVLFLQVPKGAGGAKIQTAAVTAAITGTTIMMEYVPGVILKIIVIEGTLDVYFPDRPGTFITLKAGQMIMMRPGALGFPQPVEVDIKKLLQTSDLANGRFQPLGPQANNAIAGAIANQAADLKDGKLLGTNIVLPGRGTTVVLLTGDAALAMRANDAGNPPPPGTTPAPAGKPKPGAPPVPVDPKFLPPPMLSGYRQMNNTLLVDTTAPSITQGVDVGQGAVFLPASSGDLHPWLFGTVDTVPGTGLDSFLGGSSEWTTFLVSSLGLEATPVVGPGTPRGIIFASPTTINLAPSTTGAGTVWSLVGADNWGLFTQDGGIDLRGGTSFGISGTSSNLALHANGPTANIDIANSIDLGTGNLSTFSGGDTNYRPATDITATQWTADATSQISVDGITARTTGDVTLTAGESMMITNSTIDAGPTPGAAARITLRDSTQLASLIAAAGSGGQASIDTSRGGNINIQGGNISLTGSTLVKTTGDGSRVDIVSPTGTVNLSGQSLDAAPVEVTAVDTVRVESLGGATPRVTLLNARLTANNVIAQATGTNATLDINNSEILAGQSARLYADGPGSILQFGGITKLTGANVRLAGETVRVNTGGLVDATAVSRLGIHADKHEYFINAAGTGGNWGIISTGPGTQLIQTNYAGRNQP